MAYNRQVKAYYTIEQNSYGATYREKGFTIYKIDVYPRTSVLAGQQRRTWVANFPTLQEAILSYPQAEQIEGSTYQDINSMTAHLPDDEDGW
jgi:hypothetical protein